MTARILAASANGINTRSCVHTPSRRRESYHRGSKRTPEQLQHRTSDHMYRLVDRLQAQVDQSSSVLMRLFPGRDFESLVTLPREELINLALTCPVPSTSPLTTPDPTQPPPPRAQRNSDGAESLEALEQAPDQDPELDEAQRHKDKVQGISDDVNGLSLSVDKQSTYVGVSSITAALKVIFKVAPIARQFLAQSYIETALPSRSNTPPPMVRQPDPNYLPSADVGHNLIESYFARIHVLMPMIDEEQFWHTYLYGERKDSPWLALLNMVFALGSLASSTCDNEENIAYFQRARKHLDLETFGSGNLLVLQALGLMCGYYLHWLNRPNEANCLMGATLRMATALGLHREYNEGPAPTNDRPRSRSAEVPAEIRRRTWWSLVCLDTWALMTTGRPSLGRLGPGVTAQSPRIPQRLNNAQYLASLKLLPIIHNITFAKLATRIQDALAGQSMLKQEELLSFDAELVKWHEELPPILRDVVDRRPQVQRTASTNNRRPPKAVATAATHGHFDFSQPPERDNAQCPEILRVPSAIMHYWYLTLRMLMHRPFLLATALRRASYASMSTEEKVAVSKCRMIAGQAIEDIDRTCQEELIAGWNAVWLMYQAAMVPLVSLFSCLSTPAAHVSTDSPGESGNELLASGRGDVCKWRLQIETAIAFFDRMQHFSVAAKKSRDVVKRLYEASKYVGQYTTQQAQKQKDKGNQRRVDHANQSFDFAIPPPAAFVTTGNMSFAAFNRGQDMSVATSIWGLSPNGDAAMDSFWDDMMWDTFPDVQDSTVTMEPWMEPCDWMPVVEQPSNGSAQDPTIWTDGPMKHL